MNILKKLPFIYDVATSDKNWINALDQFCYDGGVKGVAFFSSDNTTYNHRALAMNSYYSNREDVASEYFSLFQEIDKEGVDILTKKSPFVRIEDEEIWPGFTNMQSRPDLKFLVDEMGVFRRAAYNISNSKGWNAVVSLNYGMEICEFDKFHIQNANLLAFHLGKALEINRFYSDLRKKYQAVLTMLDHVDVGICIVRRDGEVVIHNSCADNIIDADDGITMNRYNHLVLLDQDANNELKNAVYSCAGTAVGKSNTSEKTLPAMRKSSSDRYLLEITPLRDGEDELNDSISGAIVLIFDPAKPLDLKSLPMRDLFNLTKAELETVELIFQCHSEQEIAEIRNVSLNTAKNQRKSIYSKVGVHNRAQLIRTAMKISPPIN